MSELSKSSKRRDRRKKLVASKIEENRKLAEENRLLQGSNCSVEQFEDPKSSNHDQNLDWSQYYANTSQYYSNQSNNTQYEQSQNQNQEVWNQSLETTEEWDYSSFLQNQNGSSCSEYPSFLPPRNATGFPDTRPKFQFRVEAKKEASASGPVITTSLGSVLKPAEK